jgi:hypothetical protein
MDGRTPSTDNPASFALRSKARCCSSAWRPFARTARPQDHRLIGGAYMRTPAVLITEPYPALYFIADIITGRQHAQRTMCLWIYVSLQARSRFLHLIP